MRRLLRSGVVLVLASSALLLGSCTTSPSAPSRFETTTEAPAAEPEQSDRPNGVFRLEDLQVAADDATNTDQLPEAGEEIIEEVREEGPESIADPEDVVIMPDQDELSDLHTLTSRTYALTGAVKDKNRPGWMLSGAKVAIVGGTSAITDRDGRYSLKVSPGTITLKVSRSGYKTLSIKVTIRAAMKLDVLLPAVIPSGATARCNNRTWSTTRTRTGACGRQGGVAYWVCPGLLCNPAPPPAAPPPPPPPSSTRFYVWGGPGYTQFLGYFSCRFCTEYGSDSLNNQFGKYGSQFSSTSIRNEFSQYGSPYSTYSACNSYASNPPRIYNESRTVWYGELTINPYRVYGVDSLINWLRGNVCAH